MRFKIERYLILALLILIVLQVLELTPALIRDQKRIFSSQEESRQEERYLKEVELQEELPSYYDAREYGICPVVKEQGSTGNCWAVAATTALEAGLLPEENIVLSARHMSEENSFSGTEEGGDYTMIMAYLAGWQGPTVDSSGEGDSETVVKHVQDIRFLKEGTIAEIKQAVYEYGAVQTSIYMDLENAFSSSAFYNQYEYAYHYNGEKDPNHDVCILGWDDDFPADAFYANTKENGAFICQNSWGEKFGDEGIFYISYEDVLVRENLIIYTGIEDADNYDHLYQTDICGWVGVLGYGDSSAYFANRFPVNGNETIEAVGFYATGPDTHYKIFLLEGYQNLEHINLESPIAEGYLDYSGFYTILLEEPRYVQEAQTITVVIWLDTPGEGYPIATEYQADEKTGNVTISDGDGYISHNGMIWEGSESGFCCNVCMKLYTKEG